MAEYRSVATLPPAANWYCGNILAVSRTGWLCWGAKSGLVVARHSEDQYPTVITVGEAHSDKVKVTAVSWCPQEEGGGRERSDLVSAAEDGVARAWRLEAGKLRLVFVGQAQTGSGRVTCLSRSQADTSLVILGGETGSRRSHHPVLNDFDLINLKYSIYVSIDKCSFRPINIGISSSCL